MTGYNVIVELNGNRAGMVVGSPFDDEDMAMQAAVDFENSIDDLYGAECIVEEAE